MCDTTKTDSKVYDPGPETWYIAGTNDTVVCEPCHVTPEGWTGGEAFLENVVVGDDSGFTQVREGIALLQKHIEDGDARLGDVILNVRQIGMYFDYVLEGLQGEHHALEARLDASSGS